MDPELALFRDMASALPDPVFVFTESGRYAAYTGGKDADWYHDCSHLVGCTVYDAMAPEKADFIVSEIRKTLETGRLRTVAYRFREADVEGLDKVPGPAGEIFFEGRIRPLPVPVDGERAVIWVARNVSDRSAPPYAADKRESVCQGVGNALSVRLAECFQRWQSEAVPSALILLRLDRYRRIRGSMGHAIAEELSGCVEELLRGSLRDGNALYPTVHGEFAVVLPGVDAGEASRIADGFVGAVARQWGRQGFDGLRVTVRAGVSEFSVLDRGVGDIRERAAAALSQSRKESGAS